MANYKKLILDYFSAISGTAKPDKVLDKYITDQDLKNHIRFFENAFPDYQLIADELLQENNRVAVRGTIRGVHTGDMMGIPPSGKKISISLMLICEIENKKILKHWMVTDNFSLMQQLGVIQ